ncbi:baseplate hub protein [Brevundimonas sp.]|jgi:hypothetical protein|uniref:baseplate hub domain-containing protein n=1 Tax=Brevundimonas sp. TaxID=1871086 RepID=UPI002E103E36|nr:DUF2163 domain-containing protein [Brevundimonas sp.]
MRDIPEDLVARIESGAARLCHAWIVTRAGGERLGFTDHDRALEVDGVVCSPSEGWGVGASEAEVGGVAGTATAEGAAGEGFDPAAFDGASVDLWRVDWSEPALKAPLWAGSLARLTLADGKVTVELEGSAAKLDRAVGRTYGRACDAEFRDARCGVASDAFPGMSCDKRWRTCVDAFGNGANFRGFPHVPGDDFIAAVPVEGGRHDGGRR